MSHFFGEKSHQKRGIFPLIHKDCELIFVFATDVAAIF